MRSGRLAKRRLGAGGYACAAFLLAALLLRRLRIGCNVLLAAAAAFNGSQAEVYFAGSRLYHCTCSYKYVSLCVAASEWFLISATQYEESESLGDRRQ